MTLGSICLTPMNEWSNQHIMCIYIYIYKKRGREREREREREGERLPAASGSKGSSAGGATKLLAPPGTSVEIAPVRSAGSEAFQKKTVACHDPLVRATARFLGFNAEPAWQVSELLRQSRSCRADAIESPGRKRTLRTPSWKIKSAHFAPLPISGRRCRKLTATLMFTQKRNKYIYTEIMNMYRLRSIAQTGAHTRISGFSH